MHHNASMTAVDVGCLVLVSDPCRMHHNASMTAVDVGCLMLGRCIRYGHNKCLNSLQGEGMSF
jgi:hypothetical protein